VEKVNMSCQRALKAAKAGKKVRIFYISDYDRYGMTMVPAVARKIEFFYQGIQCRYKAEETSIGR